VRKGREVRRREDFTSAHQGVVTLSQIERDSPTTVHADDRYFNDLACYSIAKIRLISLNVTTPFGRREPRQMNLSADRRDILQETIFSLGAARCSGFSSLFSQCWSSAQLLQPAP
jgi:hypothetical protein